MASGPKNTRKGLDELPRASTFRPHRRDCDPTRGALEYAMPQHMIMDFGDDADKAPASATFTAQA